MPMQWEDITTLTEDTPYHAYVMGKQGLCRVCSRLAGDRYHLLTLAGMSDADAQLEAARFRQQAEELTAIMRQPGKSISAKAGQMEREAPLFFGTGENPTLF